MLLGLVQVMLVKDTNEVEEVMSHSLLVPWLEAWLIILVFNAHNNPLVLSLLLLLLVYIVLPLHSAISLETHTKG
jgi:hypothetical protein